MSLGLRRVKCAFFCCKLLLAELFFLQRAKLVNNDENDDIFEYAKSASSKNSKSH